MKVLRENKAVNAFQYLKGFNEKCDHKILKAIFKFGNREDIRSYEQLIPLDWKRDLTEKKLLPFLSRNSNCNLLMSQLMSENKIVAKARDEKGRNLLFWACKLEARRGLVKYLLEEQRVRLEKDINEKGCLDVVCTQFFDQELNKFHG